MTPPRPVASEAEAYAGIAGKPLHVRDAAEHDRDAAVVGVELVGALRARRERLLEGVGTRGWDVGADDRAAGERRPRCGRILDRCSCRANHLCQDAVHGVGMDERDLQSEQPHSWALVDQLGAGGHELAERCCDIVDLVGDMVQARARLARNRCTAVSVPAGASNSTRLGPRSSDAASTPWSETAARCSSTPPKSRSYVAIAASRSLTATPRWWMPRVVTRPMLSTRYSTARSSARIVPTVSAELDSCPMPTIIATNSWRSIVSFSSSVSASRSSGARCLRRSRVASS